MRHGAILFLVMDAFSAGVAFCGLTRAASFRRDELAFWICLLAVNVTCAVFHWALLATDRRAGS